MHVILVSVGTDGDIFPYVGLGVALRARGHSVTLVASEHYEPLAKIHGFAFQALVSAEENHELFGHPDFWNPRKNAPLMARWGVRFIRRQYDLLAKLATRETVLVANPGVFAASLVHEKLGVPLTNLILQPWMIPSSIAPPIMPNFTFLSHAPRPVWKVFWRGLDVVGFLTKYREQLPDSLPPSVLHCGFAPFQKLFPHCVAVMHHGGIGTVAGAMAAGIPQLIRPLCFDQIDNGMRAKRLGAGDCLRATRSNGKQIATALAALMTDKTRAKCRQLMAQFDESNALTTAAKLVETLAPDRATTSSSKRGSARI